MSTTTTPPPALKEWPLWEVFVRPRSGLEHKHCGSLHASDAAMALQLAREVYTRRQEGSSIWVIPSAQITASDPGDKEMYFDPAQDKVYRHPTFYTLPDSVNHSSLKRSATSTPHRARCGEGVGSHGLPVAPSSSRT